MMYLNFRKIYFFVFCCFVLSGATGQDSFAGHKRKLEGVSSDRNVAPRTMNDFERAISNLEKLKDKLPWYIERIHTEKFRKRSVEVLNESIPHLEECLAIFVNTKNAGEYVTYTRSLLGNLHLSLGMNTPTNVAQFNRAIAYFQAAKSYGWRNDVWTEEERETLLKNLALAEQELAYAISNGSSASNPISTPHGNEEIDDFTDGNHAIPEGEETGCSDEVGESGVIMNAVVRLEKTLQSPQASQKALPTLENYLSQGEVLKSGGDVVARIRSTLGNAHFHLDQYSKAIDYYKDAIRYAWFSDYWTEKKKVATLTSLADALTREKRFQEASSYYKLLIDGNSKRKWTLTQKQVTQFEELRSAVMEQNRAARVNTVNVQAPTIVLGPRITSAPSTRTGPMNFELLLNAVRPDIDAYDSLENVSPTVDALLLLGLPTIAP